MRLVMLGPGLEVHGGVSTVQRLILGNLPSSLQAHHIPTMVDGSKVRKFWTFVASIVHFEIALRRGVDVVHIHFSSGASSARKEILARRALRAGMRVIMHAHGGEYRQYWKERSPAQRRRTLAVLTRVTALIVLGDVWKEFFMSIGVPCARIFVLPNPVSLPASIPQRRGREVIEFVYLGIINRNKGAFDLLEAIRILGPAVRERCHFVVAGNGEPDRLRDLVSEYKLEDKVAVSDWITAEDRDRLLANADVFVLPSYNEAMPMALLEAMAWGLPPISTPVGSILDVVTHGKNGLLVQPGNVQAIASAISGIIADESARLAMGKAARYTVEPLAIEIYVRRLLALYSRFSTL